MEPTPLIYCHVIIGEGAWAGCRDDGDAGGFCTSSGHFHTSTLSAFTA